MNHLDDRVPFQGTSRAKGSPSSAVRGVPVIRSFQFPETRVSLLDTQHSIDTANLERTQNLTRQAENLINTEQFDEAISVADQAMEITPNYSGAVHAKANALYLMGRSSAANELLISAIARDPADWNARFFCTG